MPRHWSAKIKIIFFSEGVVVTSPSLAVSSLWHEYEEYVCLRKSIKATLSLRANHACSCHPPLLSLGLVNIEE